MVQKRSRIKNRIVSTIALSDHPLFPKEIAKKLKVKHSTVKVYCRQLLIDGELIQSDNHDGYLTPAHVIRESGAVYEPFKLHGIKLEHRYNPKVGPPFLPMASQVTFRGHRHPVNKSFTDSWEFEGRMITITEHINTGLIEIFPHADNDQFDFQSFQRFLAWVQGRYPRIPLVKWHMIMMGAAWDRTDFRLEGLTSMTVQAFNNFWIQIYQKTKDMVRVEGHMVTDISIVDAFQILMDVTESIEKIKMVRM